MWVHAVSVGEVQAAVPFIKAAREDGWDGPFVISTTTQTGKAMAERLGKDLYDFHIYYPWDKNLFVRRALDALNPAAFAAAETELWPNMLSECRNRGIPAFLINGRISDRTWARVQGGLRRPLARGAYSLFASLFLRDEEDRERLTRIGVEEKKLFVMGDGKVDALLARRNEAARDKLAAELGEPERPIFIAGSTHTGEDEKVLAAFAILRGRHPEARLVIAPRHPERAAAVALLVPAEYRTVMFSGLTAGWDVLIIDRIGVLFDLYGASRSAFVGGSFADKGGQNILEPFSWGVPHGGLRSRLARLPRDGRGLAGRGRRGPRARVARRGGRGRGRTRKMARAEPRILRQITRRIRAHVENHKKISLNGSGGKRKWQLTAD